MKKTIIITIALSICILSHALPVKLKHKLLKNGAKAYSCELLTGNVNYKLVFKVTEKNKQKFISGIGLLGGKNAIPNAVGGAVLTAFSNLKD